MDSNSSWLDIINRTGVDQAPTEVIDIANWDVFEDYDVFPEGARDKSLRVCPSTPPYGFCLPDHRYLFKEAIKSAKTPGAPRHPDQYWSEVIAFRLGRLMGLTVPPVFVAIDSKRNEPGTVNEWFIGYSGTENDRYVAGGDYMQRHIEGFDRDKGRQHNLSTIIQVSRALAQKGLLEQDWKEYWGLCLCFDALTGNTDRHQENWGLIWNENGSKARFAPYFDNGTSLGHELNPAKMRRMRNDPSELEGYLRRGRHQMRWARQDERRLNLVNGVERFCEHHPDIRPLLHNKLTQWSGAQFSSILENYTNFEIPAPLTVERAEFVEFLTLTRRERLLQVLG